MNRNPIARAATTARRLYMTAELSGVDVDKRELRGQIVPFGKEGRPGGVAGRKLTFAAGSISVTEPQRVKLLRDHDPLDPVGFGVEFTETEAGMFGVFSVPEGENGDRALAEAANGLRDAFSVGVELDDATMQAVVDADPLGDAVAASGALREVSLLTIPAYDDARVAASGALVVAGWTTPTNPSADGAGTTKEGTPMNEKQRRRLAALLGQATLTQAEATELGTLQAQATAEGITVEPAAPAPEGPTPVQAVAGGAAQVTSEPSTYTFAGGEGNSLVSDLLRAGLRNDSEAAERVATFNAELAGGNPASVAVIATAAATTTDVDGVGTDLPSVWQPNPNRPDLMRQLADVNRPFVSRLDKVSITNAQPFSIPRVGEFSGVGPHTEGQPHRPAGNITLGGDTLTPKAMSGAWEVSRELLDQSNPAIDAVAVRAMMRDYQRQTEGLIVELLDLLAADPAAWVYGINTAMAVRGAMDDFVNDDDEAANLVVVSKAMKKIIGADVDGQDRAQLPFVGATNALGTAGGTGMTIDGQELIRSARLDSGVVDANKPAAGGIGVLMRKQGVLWAESAVQQFRFDEVLGPGVVKLALWAYAGAALLDAEDVQLMATGADPTP